MMTTLRRWLQLVLFISVALHAARVEAVLSSDEVVRGNTVQLRLIAEGEKVQFPTVNRIDGMPVLDRSMQQSTSLEIINGKSTMRHIYTMVLTFEPTKTVHIPAFRVIVDGKEYRTKPLTVRVVKAAMPSANGAPFFLKMTADRNVTVVGEPVVVHVYFGVRDDVRLSDNPQYQAPDFQGFYAKMLKGQRRYEKNGYRITELRYVLTPQKEGEVTILPARAKVGVYDTSRRDLFGRFFGTVWKPIQSNPLHITVRSLNVDSDLVGKFSLHDRIDTRKVQPNKPVHLTVTIEGEGSLDDFEFPDFNLSGVTVYSDDATVTSEERNGRIFSRWQKQFVFIGDRDFTIPSRTISVFDPDANRTYTLETRRYAIRVVSSHPPVSTPSPTQPAPSQPSPSNEPTQPSPSNEPKVFSAASPHSVPLPQTRTNLPAWPLWAVGIVAFLAGVASVFVVRMLTARLRRKRSVWRDSDALRILYPHMDEDSEVEAMVRLLYAKKRGEKVTIDKKKLKALLQRYKVQ